MLEEQVQAEYQTLRPKVQDWLSLSEIERWRGLLFPFQTEISREKDKEKLNYLIDKRVRILHRLLEFVFETGRFEEARVDTSFYVL